METSVKYEDFTGTAFSSLDNSSFKTVVAKEGEVSPFRGYIPLSPVKSDLRKSREEEYLIIQGRILDKTGSWPAGDAGIEIWHLTQGTMEFKHRAKLCSDPSGAFQLITDLPARQRGQSFKIYFKITVGTFTYYTQLSFNHCVAWLASRSYRRHKESFQLSKLPAGVGTPSIFQLEIRLNKDLN